MTLEASVRHHHQRAIAEAVRVAISRACVSLDLPKGADTSRAIIDALAQVAQFHQIELDLAVDPQLGCADAFGKAGA